MALLLISTQALAASTTIGRLAPNIYQYSYPYSYYYYPPTALCSTPEDLLQPSVSSGTGYVVPANGTTITSWSTNASAGAGQTMTLKVFRQTADPSTYEVIGHDGPRSLTPGSSTMGTINTFSGLSLTVQPGDVIGLYPDNANTVSDACMFPSNGDSYLFSHTNLGDASSAAFSTATGDLLNVSAIVQLAQTGGGPTQHTLSVNTTGTGTGTIQSSPPGIDSCAFSCSQAFDDGTMVTLTATPDAYSTFTGWSGGGCSGSGTCQITISSDATVTATFTASGYGSGYGDYGGGGTGNTNGYSPNPNPATHKKCKKLSGKSGRAKCAHKTKLVVKEARNQKLGQTILTTTKGLTLYSLSAETKGQFICTRSSGCVPVWHPLTVPAGVRPIGPVKLGTITRPDGGVQVTYHGHPLYRFGGDTGPGQTNGEGIKDVGTWAAVVVPKGQTLGQQSPRL
jgi:predicted lipoprotein with Yx(FWY)xxD motif